MVQEVVQETMVGHGRALPTMGEPQVAPPDVAPPAHTRHDSAGKLTRVGQVRSLRFPK